MAPEGFQARVAGTVTSGPDRTVVINAVSDDRAFQLAVIAGPDLGVEGGSGYEVLLADCADSSAHLTRERLDLGDVVVRARHTYAFVPDGITRGHDPEVEGRLASDGVEIMFVASNERGRPERVSFGGIYMSAVAKTCQPQNAG